MLEHRFHAALVGTGGAVALNLPLRYVNRIYVDLVRGTPLLVQILILYYVTANFQFGNLTTATCVAY